MAKEHHGKPVFCLRRFQAVLALLRPHDGQRVALKRFGRVEDVAAAVKFLCSEDAGYITGQVIDVNGNVLYDATLEIGEVFEQRSYLSHLPEAHNSTVDFWGIVSQSSNIREIRIDERDDNEVCPDSNIGIDTLRFAPSRCGTAGDLNLDGQIDSADVQLLIQQWGDYSPCSGETIRWSPADLDRNGTVNGADIIAMMRHAG